MNRGVLGVLGRDGNRARGVRPAQRERGSGTARGGSHGRVGVCVCVQLQCRGGAFNGCTSLNEITLPPNLSEIGGSATEANHYLFFLAFCEVLCPRVGGLDETPGCQFARWDEEEQAAAERGSVRPQRRSRFSGGYIFLEIKT